MYQLNTIFKKKIWKSKNLYFLLNANKSFKRLGKLFFLKDNSICFSFPQIFPGGILSEYSLNKTTGKIQKIDFKKQGKVTKEIVKFTYHTDGRVHFSLDGKIYTQIRMQAPPLQNQNGHIFTCYYSNLLMYPNITRRYPDAKIAGILFDDLKYSDIELSFHLCNATDFNNSNNGNFILSPDKNMIIKVDVEKKDNISNATKPVFIFVGGFNIEQTQIRFLSAMYSSSNYDELLKLLGSVDIGKELGGKGTYYIRKSRA